MSRLFTNRYTFKRLRRRTPAAADASPPQSLPDLDAERDTVAPADDQLPSLPDVKEPVQQPTRFTNTVNGVANIPTRGAWLAGNSKRPGNELWVTRGQLTFEAEGNDNPASPYFSRRLHWPGGASGVTLGRGYDMRYRTEASICADLTAAGLGVDPAKRFALGAGLSGDAARDFVRKNKAAFRIISLRSQRVLFESVVYPRYERAAQQRYQSAAEPHSAKWEDLDTRIRDVAVDLTYQQGGIWQRQLPHIAANDRQRLANYIAGTPELSRYEPGRDRAGYLRSVEN